MSITDDEIMRELESGDTFDETRLPVLRRIALVRGQLQDWEESAYSAKLAFQTNKQLGLSAEELAPFVTQFTRSRQAAKSLQDQLAALESESRVPDNRALRQTPTA